jgi:hypothetical protein
MFVREEKQRGGGRIAAATLVALVAALLGAALLLPGLAAANTEGIINPPFDPRSPAVDSGWQAGTCNAETPAECSVATPNQFFERAAAHPNFGFTQFIVRNKPGLVPILEPKVPVGELKDVRVDLPVGLSVNPGATVQCPLATFEASAASCPKASEVGESKVEVSLFGQPVAPAAPLSIVPVYNVVPKQGEAARFGLELAGNEVFLEGDVEWSGDYHEGFTIHVPRVAELEPLLKGVILRNRLVFNGRAGDGTFLTTPSTCLGEAFKQSGSIYSTLLRAASYQEEASPGYVFPQSAEPRLESPIPPGTSPKECNTIPYAPTVATSPGTGATNSPAAASVAIAVPHIKGADAQDSSNTRTATVTLPQGMGINPAAATGLATCTTQQFGKGTRNAVGCPAASQIGTVKIESPPLPEADKQLEGPVYVGQQLSRDPLSGDEYRIFIDAASPRYGVDVRLEGKVRANPVTGQLSTTISETPQVPFTSFVLRFTNTPRPSVLSSPPTCGPNQTTAVMVPWSGNPPAQSNESFALSSLPGGGACPKTLGERPFSPGFSLAPKSNWAGAYSPLSIDVSRGDGQQELKAVDVTLAPGLTGKLAGLVYCKAPELAAAAGRSGTDEARAASCPAKSRVGDVAIEAGTGPSPLKIAGDAYLSGPYKGAPLSLAVITPATAGPFDLGTVVVRVALFVDPVTAQIHAVSDPIPDVYGGTQLSVRAVRLNLDRKEFTLNPTSCEPLSSAGALRGGGGDPTNASAWSSSSVSAGFKTNGCEDLKFRPKLTTKLIGNRKKMRRNGHPRLRATLRARGGDANIARAALTLPHAEFLDQSHIGTICTRVQLAADSCPKGAIYGRAEATTPLLDDKLQGPVYLVASNNLLPDLVADLQGQVDIQLHGVISTKKARTKTVFYPVPDVPVSKFVLNMSGGKRGLLVNSRDLCVRRAFSFLNFKAQNGKKLKKKRLPLRTPSCKGKRGSKGQGKGTKKAPRRVPRTATSNLVEVFRDGVTRLEASSLRAGATPKSSVTGNTEKETAP